PSSGSGFVGSYLAGATCVDVFANAQIAPGYETFCQSVTCSDDECVPGSYLAACDYRSEGAPDGLRDTVVYYDSSLALELSSLEEACPLQGGTWIP
ncbi:MAG: hypothetical protein AAF658_09685, partial [Myxococcota bacterium]